MVRRHVVALYGDLRSGISGGHTAGREWTHRNPVLPIDGSSMVNTRIDKQSATIKMTNLIHVGVVRQQIYLRLLTLFERIEYKKPAKVYIASAGVTYNIYYDNLTEDNLTYNNLTVFVRLKSTNEITLCHLKLLPEHSLTYKAKEVEMAFGRCPTRTLQIDESQIMGYIIPCLEQ